MTDVVCGQLFTSRLSANERPPDRDDLMFGFPEPNDFSNNEQPPGPDDAMFR